MNTRIILDQRQRNLIFAAGIALAVILGIVDYYTGDLSFIIFYLVPIFLVAWLSGRWQATIVALLCAGIWLYDDIATLGSSVNGVAVPYWNFAEKLGFFVAFVYVVSALRRSYEHESTLARTDHLTGVSNVRYFYELAQAELERSRRFRRPLTLAYIDFDNFKLVNDTCGHSAGDALLRSAVSTARKTVRRIDSIARLGGDEFVVLMPETGFDQAETIMGRIHEELSALMRENGWPVTFSAGVITCVVPPKSVDEMVRSADLLMYRAKSAGKNRSIHERYEGADLLIRS